jgi:hypothetical protein
VILIKRLLQFPYPETTISRGKLERTTKKIPVAHRN